jgi:pimeloyl-ACP methyl ester carboxylesterase
MIKAQDGILEVPGATLFYKVRGSGPVLLILQGGGGDAESSEALVRLLADTYTVLTYDRRGLSRSSIKDPLSPISIEVHSEDAHRLLLALSTESACVLGASIGALIALDLITRHPEQVRALVAYEPGIADLLPEDERIRAKQTHTEVDDLYRRLGVPAAMKRMAALSGVNLEDRESDLDLTPPDSQRSALHGKNMSFFLAHDAPAAHSYKLDVYALQKVGTKILPAAGRSSQDSMPHHSVVALARLLGLEVTYFAGGHTAYFLRPKAFAETLCAAFSNPRVSSQEIASDETV